MPIMSAMDRNDARASARVLATTTKRCLDGQLVPVEHKVELKSMFRFLRAFRAHRFESYDYRPRSSRGVESLSLRPTPDRHVDDLRVALASALTDTFEGAAVEDAIDRVDQVIKAIATQHEAEEGDRTLTSRFLETFVQRLEA